MSGKVVIGSVTLGVLAAGTGISLAATQGSSSSDSVTCITVVDAKAAVDANSALSDHFAVGTGLHLTSAGRQVDVTVSGPITAAAPPATTAPATTAPATTAPATAAPTTAAPAPSGSATADPTATATTAPPAGGGTSTPPKKHHRHHHKAPASKPAAAATASTAATESNAEKAAQVGKVSIKAAVNGGVDPNTVCVELSKNAFNTLGNVANGNNVGAFLATMTPTAAAGSSSAAGASATATAAPTASATATAAPTASASSSTAAGTGKKPTKKHHH
jgi:hypothetical protein